MRKKKFKGLIGLGLAFLMSVSISGVIAFADTQAVGVMDEVPAYAEAHKVHIQQEMEEASKDLGNSKGAMSVYVDDDDRVLIGQEFDSGAIFMNEMKGRALSVADENLLSVWKGDGEPNGVILTDIIERDGAKYLITDTAIFENKAGAVNNYTFTVGQLPEDYADLEVEAERLTDRFADAYKFAVNYNADEYELGLPVSAVKEKTYTIANLKTNGKYDTGTSEKTYYEQEFEGGYIIQARLDRSPHYAAAPISKEMYQKVVAVQDNSALNVTGAPVTRQFTVENTIYQNFEYGYIKVVDGGAAEFVVDKAVSPKGTEMSRIIASFEDNWETKIYNTTYLHIQDEQVRKTEERLAAVGEFIDDGGIPYDGFGGPIADQKINHPMHEFMGRGAILKFNSSECGPKAGGYNLFVIVGNWYDDVYIVNNADFTTTASGYIGAYFKEGENKTNADDTFSGVGFPVSNTTVYKNVKYQTYSVAIIYQENLADNYTCIKGNDYIAWMEGYNSVEEALVGHGIAIDPPVNPETPILNGEGTYKAATYSAKDGVVKVYYDDEADAFEFKDKLYEAWVGANGTFEAACKENGVPVYAEKDYLITTKYYFDASGEEVVRNNGLGSLEEGTETVFGSTAYSKTVAALITDGFADAYQMANTRNDHNLGKPTKNAAIGSFKDELGDGSDIYYVIQEFENGVIIQSSYDNPAVAIFGNVLTAIEDLGGYKKTGLPIARQYTYEDKTYCNFTFGYVMIDEAGEATIEYDKAVGSKGNEIDRNIGRMESRSNVAKGGADFEHEILRIYESYLAEYERVTDTGFKLYTGAVAQGHEWNANGITQSYIAGSSTSTAWGQQKLTVMVMSNPFEKAYIVRNMILDTYATKGGNNESGNFGMPISDEFEVTVEREKNGEPVEIVVTFQNFQKGTIYSYVNTVGDAYVNGVAGGFADSEGTIVNGDESVDLDIVVGEDPKPEPNPDDNDQDKEPGDGDTEEPGGCSSFVGGTTMAFAVVAILVVVAVLCLRKKRRE